MSPEDRLIFTYSMVAVEKVVKGQGIRGIVKVVTRGGVVDDRIQYSPHAIQLSVGHRGYFFLLEDSFGEGFLRFTSDAAFVGIEQPSKFEEGVYYGGEVIDAKILKQQIIYATGNRFVEHAVYERVLNSKLSSQSSCGTVDDVELVFDFDNVKIEDNFSRVSFDLLVGANYPELGFGNADIYIRYPESFGFNTVESGKINVVKSDFVESSGYTLLFEDYMEDVIKIGIHSSINDENYALFGYELNKLLSIELELVDPEAKGEIGFEDFQIGTAAEYICDGKYFSCDTVVYGDNIKGYDPAPEAAVGITYGFRNFKAEDDGEKLTVDLYAYGSEESIFGSGNVEFSYNATAFSDVNVIRFGGLGYVDNDGDGIEEGYFSTLLPCSTGGTTCTRIYALSGEDNPDLFGNLSADPESPSFIAKFEFTVANCELPSNLQIGEATEDLSQLRWIDIGGPLDFESYLPVSIAPGSLMGGVCGCEEPSTTDFSPLSIVAGDNQELTINGTGFGVFEPGVSTVTFRNGDNSGPNSRTRADRSDIEWDGVVHWNDNQIIVRVPSVDRDQSTAMPASSDFITVVNGCDLESEESDEMLAIPYSFLNFRPGASPQLPIPAPAYPLVLKGDENGSLCFAISNDMPSWAIFSINKVFSEWCEETGIDFNLGFSENLGIEDDGVSTLTYEDGTGAGMAIQTNYFGSNACNGDELGFYFDEIDIVVRGPFQAPTSFDEFEKALKHELGHAHMLNHARSVSTADRPLMHPNNNSGNGIIRAADSEGANNVFARSAQVLDLSNDCSNPILPKAAGADCSYTGGNNSCTPPSPNAAQNNHTLFGVHLYPNPVEGASDVRISTIQVKEDLLNLTLYNASGKKLYQLDLRDSLGDEFTIPTRYQSPGVYYCRIVSVQGKIATVKYVKL